MAGGRATPIVVGVGDIKNRSQKLEDALEPMQLMLQAIQRAIKDTTLSDTTAAKLQSEIDSIDVVATWTWPYPDLPGLLSENLGAKPRHKYYSPHGGNQPAKLFDEAARRISLGQNKVAVVTGGEALASMSACAAAGKMPPPGWTKLEDNIKSVFSAANPDLLGTNLGAIHSIGLPIHVYPLYENGFRAHCGQTVQQNNQESAQLYAEFAQVAQRNPLAWNYGKPAETKESIGTVTKKNRMICFPYPLLMNAFNTVNLAGACLLTSTDYARELGIPESRWIYPLGGAGTKDSDHFWERPNFYTCPSISRSIDSSLEVCGLTKDQIDMFDFYSCFPIVPKLACRHLGLPATSPPKPITLLGGLTSFGGAGNNYSMHALTEMVRALRNGQGRNGLVLANGGVLSYQHVVCLSSQPRKDKSLYPDKNPLPEILTDVIIPTTDAQAEGEATIETYTVEFKRDGSPLRGYIVGRLKSNDHRFVANHGDANTLKQLSISLEEQIGRTGWVRKDAEKEGRNLFTFERSVKL
ncbi:hypothetical protein K432DRAFT_311184 [Lepidopterella palustris CBS 459.81]|uniref:Thiolase-like protein type 1 additional C-terminal domain-containing protein n=1 Tax=Lepidopterella palustris CBS 459.81 TaxID=1314670 RepID=A0A8E2DYY8_9PEZI|nr:hypothetical protein K432DRAFT_311184 [Lepidopterella palustris CBS 459.81]